MTQCVHYLGHASNSPLSDVLRVKRTQMQKYWSSKSVEEVSDSIDRSENSHCAADLLFYLFGFSCFDSVELPTDLLPWSNPK